MKKVIALVAALVMLVMMAIVPAVAEEEVAMTEELFAELLEEVEYEPNQDYVQYTVVEYYMEGLDTTMYAMVSANEELTEFYIQVFWYGVDDQGLVRYDAATDTFENIEDSSGFNHMVAPDILRAAIAQNYWKPVAEYVAE